MLNVNGCPRLFRGVTPDRHAGETSLAVVHNWLAHSGYPLDLDTEINPRTAAAHVPYAVLQLPMVLSIITPAHNEYHQ